MTVEATETVNCGICGSRIELSASVAGAWQGRQEKPVCWECLRPATPVEARTAAKMRRWWLAHHSLEELLELGRDLGWC